MHTISSPQVNWTLLLSRDSNPQESRLFLEPEWAKLLGGERTGTAASYMSYSGGLPKIFSTEFPRSHPIITLADKEPPVLLSYEVHFGQTFIPHSER